MNSQSQESVIVEYRLYNRRTGGTSGVRFDRPVPHHQHEVVQERTVQLSPWKDSE